MKIIINKSHGGMHLPKAMYDYVAEKRNLDYKEFETFGIKRYRFCDKDGNEIDLETPMRRDKYAIEYLEKAIKDISKMVGKDIKTINTSIIKEDGTYYEIEEFKKLNVMYSSELKVVEIPDDVKYTIEEYDGVEWIAEVHRTWS